MFEKEIRVRKHTVKVDKGPNSHKNLMLANGFQLSVEKHAPMLNISRKSRQKFILLQISFDTLKI